MKKVLSIKFLVIFFILLCACSKTNTVEYVLDEIIIDGQSASNISGYLILNSDYSGEISINDKKCSVYWSENPFSIQINDLVCNSEKTSSGLKMNLDDNKVSIIFSVGKATDANNEELIQNEKKYEGRFYFSDCEGEWTDYDGRSMYVSGTLTDSEIILFSKYFSEEVPMIQIEFSDNHCVGGYVMAYQVNEYGVVISKDTQNAETVNNLEFLHPEEYIWNKYLDNDNTEKTENLVEVVTLSGNSRNADGAFSYKIVLTEAVN